MHTRRLLSAGAALHGEGIAVLRSADLQGTAELLAALAAAAHAQAAQRSDWALACNSAARWDSFAQRVIRQQVRPDSTRAVFAGMLRLAVPRLSLRALEALLGSFETPAALQQAVQQAASEQQAQALLMGCGSGREVTALISQRVVRLLRG